MSSSDRRTFLLAPLALAACGFAPAYGPSGGAGALQGSIRAAEPRDKAAFDLVARLEERLGRAVAPRFDLTYTIRTQTARVGITPDNTIQRFQISGTVDWSLIDIASGARVDGGQVQNVAAWSATGSTIAGLSAEEDAARRLMVMLADQIVTRLIATAGRRA